MLNCNAVKNAGICLVMLTSMLLISGQSHAQARGSAPRFDPLIEQSQTFLESHPDLKYRTLAFQSYKKADYKQAMEHFMRAAFYADKPSQAMVAEMHWKGEGTAIDKATAYAWIDLAAERQFVNLLAVRERYWKGMSAEEQARAVEIGQGVYAKYGDEVAKKRLESKLRAARMRTTGSRTGAVGALTIEIAGPDGESVPVDGSQFYNEQYWRSDKYWAWQDKTWETMSRGKVNTSDLKPVEPESKP
jgi:uncharacterized protein